MHGTYCTQPSGLTPSCFSAIYAIHPSCPCYNYNLLYLYSLAPPRKGNRCGYLGWWTPPRLQLLGYMEIVPDRRAATLLPIIDAHVAAGTMIYSDQWSAYSQVGSLPNVGSHSSVNHSLHFVEPATGVHTQNIESCWSLAKWKLKGCHSHQLTSYLDEFMWRERYGSDGLQQHHTKHTAAVPSLIKLQ